MYIIIPYMYIIIPYMYIITERELKAALARDLAGNLAGVLSFSVRGKLLWV